MKVYKYVLEVTEQQTIEIPEGAQILSVQVQKGIPCIWALVDPNMKLTKRIYKTYGTGHPMQNLTETDKFIGTYQVANGSGVFHVFEVN